VNAVEICRLTGGSVGVRGVAVGRAGQQIVISLLVNVTCHCYSCIGKYE
jgi:hypothetical protein